MSTLLDPDTAENVPAKHGKQPDDVNDVEKNPGLHGVQLLDTPEPTVE